MQATTFTELGRRAQIVTGAIEVIAEVGYAKASFSRIAKHTGLSSTGMISYHFAGKADLLAACVTEIERIMEAFMLPRLEAADGYIAVLRTYVESNVALVGDHPAAVRAMIDIVRNSAAQSTGINGRHAEIAEHFRAGQAAGVFHAFDVANAATALLAGLDAVLVGAAAVKTEPAELARLGRELADLYVRATAVSPEGTAAS